MVIGVKWAMRIATCYMLVVCLRSSVDLSRHPEGLRQLLYPDTINDMSDGRSTHVHHTISTQTHHCTTHHNIHAHTNYMAFSSLSFL